MKARSLASHPLVRTNQETVLQSTKRKRNEPNNTDVNRKKVSGSGDVKKEKEMKRKHYVSIHTQEKINN
jgi:hypothetical protein